MTKPASTSEQRIVVTKLRSISDAMRATGLKTSNQGRPIEKQPEKQAS
jgi:hypothetical protein